MMTLTAVLLLIMGLPAPLPEATQELDITLYRSSVPPDLTLVEGLFRVGPEMMGGAACNYSVQLAVLDEAGTPLVRNEWQGTCPKAADGTTAAALETFNFAVRPAKYTVELTVRPEGRPEAALRVRKTVEALPPTVLASDLVLARAVGWVDSTAAVPWTFRRGELGIRAASEIVATEREPSIGYYVEVYPTADAPMTGRLVGVVKRPDGVVLARLPLQTVAGVAESRPLAGNFSVAGLAPGDYVLEARLELEDTVISRSHPFRMAAPVAAAPAVTSDAGYFWTLDDAALARLFDPVVVMLDTRERQLFANLDPDGKRRFLRQYFGGMEPTGGGLEGNALDIYLERVRLVDAKYRERAGENIVPGWRTDRGRIHMSRGEPNQVVERPVSRDGYPPYQIWQYTSGRGYVYLFLDESRFGNYRMIFTTDPTETSLPDWERRVGPDVFEDLARMGVRVRTDPVER